MDPAAALQNFRASVIEFDELFAYLTAHRTWQVPVGPDGRPLLVPALADGGLCLCACVAPLTHEEWASVTEAKPASWISVTGQGLVHDLVSFVRETCQGIAFEFGRPWRLDFALDVHLATLREAANVPMVERCLANPAPGQIHWFLEHEWTVLTLWDEPLSVMAAQTWPSIHLFTSETEAVRFQSTEAFDLLRMYRLKEVRYEFKNMAGEALFQNLAARDDYDAILFNPPPAFTHWPDWRYIGGPNYAAELLAGRDQRHGAEILQARSQAEIDLLLKLERRGDGSYSDAQTVLVDHRAVHYINRSDHKSAFLPYYYEINEGDGDAAKPSSILCPGLLADYLQGWPGLTGLEALDGDLDAEERWEVLHEWEEQSVRVVEELLKFVPEGREVIPRRRLRSVYGARSWVYYPQQGERPWILKMRNKVEANFEQLRAALLQSNG